MGFEVNALIKVTTSVMKMNYNC